MKKKNQNMKRNKCLLVIITLCYLPLSINAQQTIILNFKTVTEKYSMRSTEALNAALNYKNQMLNDQNIRKEFFPTLAFTLSPFNFNRSLRTLQRPEDGSYSYVEDYSNSSSSGLSVSQKIPYVNGTFSVSSNLSLLSEFSDDRYSFSSTPYRLSYQQKLLGEYKSY
ncbi:MAG: TolC family protein, partial [Candidatus Cloacimonetes bacterium]|nr:TolC family protein [Candidatus Cloacimonadota bacterium]